MIYNGDCRKLLDILDGRVGCIIADAPDNLGLSYDGFIDKQTPLMYYSFLGKIIKDATDHCEHFWLSYYHEHDLQISRMIPSEFVTAGRWKKYIWRFNFGQYRESDCPNGYRVILRLSQPKAALYTDDIKVPSARQMLYNDRRAAGLRVPDDVWEFPRITGNHNERRSWHPTQHPEGVYTRMLRMSTKPGDIAIDLFGGTGTLFRACKHVIGRIPVVAEQSVVYCGEMAAEHGCLVDNDPKIVLASAFVAQEKYRRATHEDHS